MKQKIDLKHLDKSNWQPFKFEEIVEKISETVKPEEADVDIYVGLEHLDREDIHIRRHGVPADVKGGKLRCYPGDIIFGKRRAYQRKAAIVDFDGICSAHAFVFRAKPEVIDPKLLPFFFHSDEFMHRMVDISVGGLSPTINWGDLKQQEFLLPPKDQQAQLAELLLAMDEVIEKNISLLLKLEIQLKVEEKCNFSKELNSKLNDVVLKTLSGGTPDTKNFEYYLDGKISWITSKILSGDRIGIGEKLITHKAVSESAAKILAKGNIVAGTRVGVGKFSINDIDVSFSQDITGLEIDKKYIDIEFLIHQLNSVSFQSRIKPFLRGTTIKGITKDDLLNLKIFRPDIHEQKLIKLKVQGIKNSINKSCLNIEASKSLQKSLINQVF
ncbi:restriction endonuclease subunit S [Marinicella rhabdoformis]|uniref:restriction endonuclease subunit S n=1 Tax=Marinicella rhabdoformis TaxID=2580566 RepID=UPI0015D0C882|nr:restriction endonuclease subunit S [Marinicella rhabdoformis]